MASNVRDTAISALAHEGGLSGMDIATLDFADLVLPGQGHVRGSDDVMGTIRREPGSVMPLASASGRLLRLYLQFERPADDSGSSAALFLARHSGEGSPGGRMSEEAISRIISERADRWTTQTGPGDFIRPTEISRIVPSVLQWSARHGCARPRTIEVVSATFDAAVKALQSEAVSAFPDYPVYVVVVQGDFLGDKDSQPGEPEGTWAALLLFQSEHPRIMRHTIRPSGPNLSDLGFGHIYSVV